MVRDWICLTMASGLGVKGIWKLVDHFGSPTAVLQANDSEITKIPGIKKSQIASLADRNALCLKTAAELKALEELGGCAICVDDALYPDMLKNIHHPPPVLYVLGNTSLLATNCIAVVGSRAASSYGRRVSYMLGKGIGECSVTVVSGLALGVDAEAHKGALSADANTIAVLGCGLDIVYPRQNKALYKEIIKKGLLVSESPLGSPPEAFRFPSRNRIISGLSLGVVVVEAAKKSGSLITAKMALDEGREIFAVPGQVDSKKSTGAHWLLQQGAKLVQGVDDILEEFNHIGMPNIVSQDQEEVRYDFEPEVEQLLDIIETYPINRNELINKAGMLPGKVSEILLFLELEGCVEILPGDQIRRLLIPKSIKT